MVDTSLSPLLGLGIAANAAASGLREGMKEGKAAFNADEDRKLARQEASQRKQLMNYQLAQAGRADKLASATQDSALQVAQTQLAEQQQSLTQQGRALLKKDTWDALDGYYEDYEPRHLNRVLAESKTNQFAPPMFKEIVRVDKVDLQSTNGKQLLQQAGFSQEDLDGLDGQKDGKIDFDKIQKRFVVSTKADGTQQLTDIVAFSAVSNYGQYAKQRQLDQMKQLADLTKAQQGKEYKAPTSQTEAELLAEVRQAQKAGTATPEQLAFLDIMNSKLQGATGAKRLESEKAIKQFYDEGYMDLPFEKLRSNPDAMSLVRQVEDSYGLSQAEKKDLKEAYQQVNAMSRAQGLSPESTGIIDSTLEAVNRKFTDSAEGREARAAYSGLINTIRNQQFGSALTDAEIAAFRKAYGADSDQVTVVLSGLREIGELTRSKLQAVADLNNDVVIKARTGSSKAEIEQYLQNIQKRIGFYSAVANGMPIDEAANKFKTTTAGQATKVDTNLSPAPEPQPSEMAPEDLARKYNL